MCGIAGLVTNRQIGPQDHICAQMIESMKHRGPDDHGWLLASNGKVARGHLPADNISPQVMMLHCRLAILDLTQAGWQPMVRNNDRLFIVFNGEIYNFKEIRAVLEKKGQKFFSTSDTEVILAAYAHWGEEAVNHFEGMFAFAIFDKQKNSMFLARDGFGIKPLYYTLLNGTFIFASEIPTLLQYPGVNREANSQALYDYFIFGASDHREGKTLFSHIHQLPAGHSLTISLNDPTNLILKQYWQPTLSTANGITFPDAVERLRELFLESISLHIRSDVPVAAALSGGLDSTAIVMAMRKEMGDGTSFNTFSFIANEAGINEEIWVDDVVQASGVGNYKVTPKPEEFAQDIDQLIKLHGEPVFSTSMYAQYRVYKLIAQHGIKVVLDGQGADEILAGYLYYLGARVTSLVRQGRYIDAGKFALNAKKRPGVGMQIFNFTGEFLIPKHLHTLPRRIIGKPLEAAWMNSPWFANQNVVMQSIRSSKSDEALREQLMQTLTATGLPKLLRFQDRNSMAFSIESRVPFLNKKIVDFLFSLPEEYLIDDGGNSKAVFREAMGGMIPQSVLNRRDKVGFTTPENSWMVHMNDLVEDTLQANSTNDIPLFKQGELQKSWSQIKNKKQPFTRQVWRWVNVIRWAEMYGVQFSK
ncbi:MAG: asparagine synthase (glutamine-hydrolyzing) [Magnetococcales bacterium]|nr:asparagine synthase (glutamine-hydrolyzing) [Magnetococcales bacterium]